MEDIDSKVIETQKCGKITVFIQGKRSPNEIIIFTIHDLGCNHKEMLAFVNHPSMDQLRNRFVWIHMDVPGQGENESDLTIKEFPRMQEIAEDLLEVFDQLQIKHAVLFGEGAGANILTRFAMKHDDRVLGTVLIHCTGTTAGIKENIRDRLISWKLNTSGMNPAAESYLIVHRFGLLQTTGNESEFCETITEFRRSLQSSINPRNLNKFIMSYMNRTNIAEKINELICPSLFVTGTLASHNHTVLTLYNQLKKSIRQDLDRQKKVELVQINGVANVLREKPEKITEAFQYFLQGLGLVGSICGTKPMFSAASRRMSMEQLDLPRGADSLSSIRKGSMPPVT